VRVWLRLVPLLQALHIFPSMQRIPRVPVEKRKGSRPPRWMTRAVPSDVVIEDHPALARGLPAPIRVYRSSTASGPIPIVMFMHGGGFVNGGLDSMQFLCGHLAATAEVLVVSVDYPLAPENPYPAALDVCYETLDWLSELGARLGGDTARIAVMGDSAGGNIAAALCLRARRKVYPRIAHQVLIYPALDATLSSPSLQAQSARRRRDYSTFYSLYVGDADPATELISPLLAESLADMPPATILTAEHDGLCDEGALYAERLAEAGVPVGYTRYAGVPHGFLSMPRLCPSVAAQALADIAAELDAVFRAVG